MDGDTVGSVEGTPMPQDPPEEAILEAIRDEERIASQSDLAKLYDALIALTKEVSALKALTEQKWEETAEWRRAGRF